MAKNYTPVQWVAGLSELSLYIGGVVWLARTAFFPKPTEKLKRYQRVIRGVGAIVFGVGLTFAIPYWLGFWGD